MAIKYRIVRNRNPVTGEVTQRMTLLRHYLVEGRALARAVAAGTTVNEVDALAVLLQLSKVLADELEQGNAVRLPGIGLFGLAVRTDAIPEKAEQPTAFLRSARVTFRADTAVREILARLQFERGDDQRETA